LVSGSYELSGGSLKVCITESTHQERQVASKLVSAVREACYCLLIQRSAVDAHDFEVACSVLKRLLQIGEDVAG